jgi:hypothetical protein
MLFTDRARVDPPKSRIATSGSAAFNCGLHHRASFDEDIFW